MTAATQSGNKRKVFGGGAREMHDNDVAIICERGYSAEVAGTALRNNNYNVAAALKVNIVHSFSMNYFSTLHLMSTLSQFKNILSLF